MTSRRAPLPSQGRALNLIHWNTMLPDSSVLRCRALWQELLGAKHLEIQSDKIIPNSSSHHIHPGTSGTDNSLSQHSPLTSSYCVNTPQPSHFTRQSCLWKPQCNTRAISLPHQNPAHKTAASLETVCYCSTEIRYTQHGPNPTAWPLSIAGFS